MRLIDVCIPNFGDDRTPPRPSLQSTRTKSGGFQLQTLFGQAEHDYTVDEEDEDQADDANSANQEDQFFEAEDGSPDVNDSPIRCPLLTIYYRIPN